MKRYKAIITPKENLEADEYQVAIVSMEIDFIIGPKAGYDGPELIIERTLKDMRLWGLMNIEYRKVGEPGLSGYPETECTQCKAHIYLVPSGLHFMWVVDPSNTQAWRCDSNPSMASQVHFPRHHGGD